MTTNALITGWGMYAPSRVMTNEELSTMVETSDEWIVSRTGIRERRIAADDETTATLSVHASRDALAVAGLDATDLDLIILGTCTPDYYMPSTAVLVGDQLGATRSAGFDVMAACSGFIFSLATPPPSCGAACTATCSCSALSCSAGSSTTPIGTRASCSATERAPSSSPPASSRAA